MVISGSGWTESYYPLLWFQESVVLQHSESTLSKELKQEILNFPGNLICLVVLTKSRLDLKPAFSNILKCLSVFDILFLVILDPSIRKDHIYRMVKERYSNI